MFNGAFEDRELKNIMVQHTTTNSLINKNMKTLKMYTLIACLIMAATTIQAQTLTGKKII